MDVTASARAVIGPTVRKARDKYDCIEVRHARLLTRRIRVAPLDILHLGASESIHIGVGDLDTRNLPQMIQADLPASSSFYSITGAGYQAELLRSYLRIVEPLHPRPIIVMAFVVRMGMDQWRDHPRYGHRRSTEYVLRIKAGGPTALMRRRAFSPSAADFDSYDAVELDTFIGMHPRGYFRKGLRGLGTSELSPDESETLRYAYFWGGRTDVADEWLTSIRSLGEFAKVTGYDVVPYHAPLPLVQGEAVLPGFAKYVTRNVEKLETAFQSGYGPVEFIRAGMAMGPDEFIDPADASEHINENGRRHLATDIVERLGQRLSTRS